MPGLDISLAPRGNLPVPLEDAARCVLSVDANLLDRNPVPSLARRRAVISKLSPAGTVHRVYKRLLTTAERACACTRHALGLRRIERRLLSAVETAPSSVIC
jgi:hypothetical protein